MNLESLQQKAKERTVKTQNVEYDLETLVKKISIGTIKLDPDYQRRHRWSELTSSRLIESLILNIPVPVVYISQDVDVDDDFSTESSRYTVIDGQQRLTAIKRYIQNEYQLQGLEALPELNGYYYRELPSFLFRRLEERTIRCMRIDSTLDQQVKFDIFERLNTGSVKLEAQELRNATSRGPFNELIKNLSENESFRNFIQVGNINPYDNPKVQKMEDVELVLRFFALSFGRYKELKKGFGEFLSLSQSFFNECSEQEINIMKENFLNVIDVMDIYNEKQPFAKYRLVGSDWKKMSSFNAAVYDAYMAGITNVFSHDFIRDNKYEIANKLKGSVNLFKDADFFASVSGSVNDANKVKFRIEAMSDYLRV